MTLRLDDALTGLRLYNPPTTVPGTVAIWVRRSATAHSDSPQIAGSYRSVALVGQNYECYPYPPVVPGPEPYEWNYFVWTTDGSRTKYGYIYRDVPNPVPEEFAPLAYGYPIARLCSIGKTGTYAYENGSPGAEYCYCRMWSEVLTPAEMNAEKNSKTPVRTADLITDCSLTDSLVSEFGAENFVVRFGTAYSFTTDLPNSLSSPSTDVAGGMTANESKDTTAFAGQKAYTSSLATLEGFDLAAFSGIAQKQIAGTLAVNETKDTAAFAASAFTPGTVDGGMQASESKDTTAFAGQKAYIGDYASVEGFDLAAFSGLAQKQIAGMLAVNETKDVGAFSGSSFLPGSIGGSLTTTENRDAVAFSGAKAYSSSLNAIESRDLAAFSGLAQKQIAGILAANESKDVAAFSDGLSPEGEVANTIVVRDGNSGIGISPETAWKDGAPSWARGGSNGETQFPMSIGNPQNTDDMSNNASARQMRLLQAPGNTPAGSDIVPGWFSYIDVTAGEWVWCMSRVNISPDVDNPIGLGNEPANGTPSAPLTPATSAPAQTSMTLSWAAPASPGNAPVTSYRVYQSTDNVAFTLAKDVGVVLTTSMIGLVAGTTYWFKVAAINSVGIGPPSVSATGTTLP